MSRPLAVASGEAPMLPATMALPDLSTAMATASEPTRPGQRYVRSQRRQAVAPSSRYLASTSVLAFFVAFVTPAT